MSTTRTRTRTLDEQTRHVEQRTEMLEMAGRIAAAIVCSPKRRDDFEDHEIAAYATHLAHLVVTAVDLDLERRAQRVDAGLQSCGERWLERHYAPPAAPPVESARAAARDAAPVTRGRVRGRRRAV